MHRLFGLSEATKLIPLLQNTFVALQPVAERLREVLEELERAGRSSARLEEREQLAKQIQRLLNPLEELGIEVKSVEGLVDFRAKRNGQTVYLCWKFPEAQIGFWHELETGYAGRQAIVSSEEFEDSLLC